jgi:hypothetical protein
MSILRFSIDLVVTELAVIAFPGARATLVETARGLLAAPLTVPKTVSTMPT